MGHVCTQLRTYVRAYIRAGTIGQLLFRRLCIRKCMLVHYPYPPPPPRRGIHVCRVRYVVKRHNGGISENPDAESPTAGCRLETDFRPVRTRQSRLHATLQHLLNVSDGWIRIWMKRFKKDASQTGV
jgi:hypothetical protein